MQPRVLGAVDGDANAPAHKIEDVAEEDTCDKP